MQELDVIGFRIDRERLDKHLDFISNSDLNSSEFKKAVLEKAKNFSGWTVGARGHSMAKDVVDKFLPEDEDAQNYFRIEGLKRAKTTLTKIKESLDVEDRVYPKHVFKEDLGRIYVSGFVYTSLPREYRDIVIPHEDNHKIVYVDARFCELKVWAMMAQDNILLADLKAEDFYRSMYARFAGIETCDVTDAQRKIAKEVWFSLQYGASNESVAEDMGIDVTDVEQWTAFFKERYQKAHEFRDTKIKEAQETRTAVSVFGTKKEWSKDAVEDLEKVGRSAFSHIVQSSAAELIKNCYEPLKAILKPHGYIFGIVFDAFLISADIEKLNDKLQGTVDVIIPELLHQLTSDLGYPLNFCATVSDRWGE